MMKLFKFKNILPQVPNLLIRGRFKFKFEHLPFEARGITWKKKWNFFMAGLNQFLLPSRPLGRPVIAQVEPANVCNLDCPLCFTTSKTSARASALLPFDTFKRLIDDVGDYLLLIVLWNWGEPFLNPDILKIIEYATSRNILVHSSTNGNVMFADETADKIVDSGLTSLVFGVDGATPETYREYRKGGDLERVKENIRTLVRAKKRKSSCTPLLNLRFVAMRHNEAELPLAEEMARELEVDFFSIKSVDLPPALGKDLEQTYRPGKNEYRRYEYVNGTYTRVKKPFVCMRPWKRITLDALGEVIPCEYDYKNLHSFGHIGNGNPVSDVWKSERSKTFRRHFHKGHNDFYHCRACTYKNLRMEDCIINAYPVCAHRQETMKTNKSFCGGPGPAARGAAAGAFAPSCESLFGDSHLPISCINHSSFIDAPLVAEGNETNFTAAASVIVCTYNRSQLLKRLLESLACQTAPADTFEIIVVDDGSSDDTAAVCRSLMERMPNMKYITMGCNSGLSAAGNRAISEARGEYLLFTDDDCIPYPSWVEKMCAVLKDSPIAAGTVVSPLSNYFKLCHNIAQFYPFMPGQKSRKADFIAGANMGIQARVVKEIGEFRTDTIIPDMDFILRARLKGFTIAYAPEALVTHDPRRITLGNVLGYAAVHASETILLRHRYRELLHTPFVLSSTVLIMLAAPVIALKTTAAIYLGNRELIRYFHTAPVVYLIKLAWCWGAARGLLGRKRKQAR